MAKIIRQGLAIVDELKRYEVTCPCCFSVIRLDSNEAQPVQLSGGSWVGMLFKCIKEGCNTNIIFGNECEVKPEEHPTIPNKTTLQKQVRRKRPTKKPRNTGNTPVANLEPEPEVH